MNRWLRISQLARLKPLRRSGAGYTITETLIVLAVTTLMFAAIALLFEGRQARAEFTQSVRNYEGRIETIVSEVVNGNYFSEGIGCTVSLSGPPNLVAGTDATGSKQDCIFVGKTIEAEPPTGVSTRVRTLVGRRMASGVGSDNVENLVQANPVIASSVEALYDNSYQLKIEKIVNLGTNTQVAAVGFINKFSRGVSSNDSGSSGPLDLYAATANVWYTGSVVNTGVFLPMSRGVIICLSGQNGQNAEITIGADGNPTSLVSTLDTAGTGACL
ncbi:MAG: hypothetical protein M3Q36_03305 [bacterium]|nr:hypothetical protein [bacterium]